MYIAKDEGLHELTYAQFAEELFEEKTSSNLSLAQTFPSCKWVFPSSQERYSTVFQEELDEWFDIYSLTNPAEREELQIEGLHDSVEFLLKILNNEAKIVGPDRVILLGLSQGCAIGMGLSTRGKGTHTNHCGCIGIITLLASRLRIGGYVGLSGWMPFKAQIEECYEMEDLATLFKTTLGLDLPILTPEESIRDTPIFLGHTADDEVIDVELGREMRDLLKSKGMKVVWEEKKDGGHLGMLKPTALDSVVAFLKNIIS